MLRSVHGTSED